MHYHLVLTQKCNLNCRYCGSSVEPTIMPVELSYPIDNLKNFLKHDEEPVIAFYGGEPAISDNRIMQIMDEIDAKAFVIQTNGTLLHRIPKEYIARFHSILISIDGDNKLTDFYRGEDVYERALKGARYARESGFTGDLIARMTVSEETGIFEAVTHLLEVRDGIFDHVHWQLDAMWDLDEVERWKDFDTWVKKSYNPGISRLVDYWLEQLEQGELKGIVPFVAIMHTLLTETKVNLRCGSGIDFFSITTDGRITFCPILPSVEFAVVGDINTDKPFELPGRVGLEEPCLSQCEVRHICGGRCLYTNKTKYWGEEGFAMVCNTIKHLIKELQRIQPKVQKLVDLGKYHIQQFNYPEVENGVEIIP
ncbi:MAG: TIGR04084 family radical SAM/SPASM domain-containing protein [Candidatus Heimdallarchaeota archaeon]|nr:TIGR04084 family radical SAM/SPASM domain-containing protein [Candidatus Heimdallarchaeota archaeon]